MGHEHSHSGASMPTSRGRRLKFALALTVVYMAAEAIGGWYTNSLALIADAGHMFTDAAALTLTLVSFWFARRPATPRKTYGFYRAEILAAFVNGVALVLLSLLVIYEAMLRWSDPPEVLGGEMSIIAAGGLVVNLIVLGILHGDHSHDLNMRGAWLHVAGDLLGSIAALAAGGAILLFGAAWADPVSSIVISLIIMVGAWRLVSESVNILLEGTPLHIDLAAVERSILSQEGVTGLHDLHVWTISSGLDALSVHINHEPKLHHSELLSAVRKRLHDEFGIDHLTIQIETAEREAEAVYICETGTRCFEPVTPAERAL